MRIGSYILTHVPSGYFYIGSSTNVDRRIRHHKTCMAAGAHGNKNLQRVWTCWEDFDYVIFTHRDVDEMLDNEQYLIDKWIDNPLCCNIGRDVRNKFLGAITDDHRKIAGIKRKGRPGKLHTEETRLKIGLARLGATHSEESRSKISASKSRKVSIEGKIYDSARVASEELSIPERRIRNRLNSHRFEDWIFCDS